MIATCIKTDPLQTLEVGKEYDYYKRNNKVHILGVGLVVSEDIFNEHFVTKLKTREDEQDEALVKYLDECGETQDSDLCCGFIDGWDKADENMIEKACKWLREHLGAPEGIPQAKSYNDAMNELITEFRNAMKGGEQ